MIIERNMMKTAEVVANCDHLTSLKFSPYLPYAFTEHAALMEKFLKSDTGVEKLSKVSTQ